MNTNLYTSVTAVISEFTDGSAYANPAVGLWCLYGLGAANCQSLSSPIFAWVEKSLQALSETEIAILSSLTHGDSAGTTTACDT